MGVECPEPTAAAARSDPAVRAGVAVDRPEELAAVRDDAEADPRRPVGSGGSRPEPVGPRDTADALVEALGGPAPRVLPTDEELEQRFGQRGPAELEGAMKALLWVRGSKTKPLLDRKMETGQYRVDIVPTGSEFEQTGSFPDGTPRATRHVAKFLDDGMTEYHTAEVHQSELWDLMVLDEEIAWIGHRRAQLSKEAEAASDG